LVKAAISLDGMGGELYLQGAQLTVWQPPGERPVLFTSPNSAFATARQFAVASQSSSRGSSPVGTRWRRRSTALRAPHHGISTGRTVGRESLTLTFSLGDSDAEFGSKLLGLHRSFLSQGIIIADCGAATPSRNSAGRGAEDSFGSTADILRLLERVSFTPVSRPIRQLDRRLFCAYCRHLANLP